MSNAMNLYTLTFKDQQLELQYQSQSIQKTLKPLYYAILVSAMLMYSTIAIVAYLNRDQIRYINMSIILTFFIVLIVIYKNDNQIQISMTIANCVILLQQLNIGNMTIDNQYQFMNGSLFAVLQTGLCFAIDFKYSFPAIIIHFVFRFIILTYYVESFDYMLFLMGFLTLVFISSVLYICNRAQRLQFLMNLKDDTITKQLETLINHPFSKLRYHIDKLQIEVTMVKDVELFPGYSDELCIGCNIRNFLRNSLYNGQSIEVGLVNGIIPLNQSLTVLFNREQIRIRICDYSIDKSLILIQESSIIISNKKINQQIIQQLKGNFKAFKMSKENQLYKFGIMTILMMNQKTIRTINVIKMIKKLKSIYNFKTLVINHNENEIKLTTYAYLFQIYFIQIFNIFSELGKKNNILDQLEIFNFEICLVVKLKVKGQAEHFLKYYYSNFFISQFSEILLLNPIQKDLIFQFSKVLAFK